jgi:hypothetical protein
VSMIAVGSRRLKHVRFTMIAKSFDESTENPQGEALVEELRWVHGIIRSNLQTVAAIIAQVNAGAAAERIQTQVKVLASTSALWTLRVNCFRYCQLVHGHHRLEDIALFPRLRRFHPALGPVIDKLEADHVIISNYLDRVEAATERLVEDESARIILAAALNEMAEHLLTHLDFEEAHISPTLRRMDGWL